MGKGPPGASGLPQWAKPTFLDFCAHRLQFPPNWPDRGTDLQELAEGLPAPALDLPGPLLDLLWAPDLLLVSAGRSTFSSQQFSPPRTNILPCLNKNTMVQLHH